MATKRILLPIAFVLMIVRPHYPASWIQFLEFDNQRLLCREIRLALDLVDTRYWCELDHQEMILE